MVIKVEVIGVNDVQALLKRKEKAIVTQTQKGLFKAAVFMQGEVKESIAGRRPEHVSVDTGRFLNSVDISVGKEDASIFSPLDYAQFLEYGTSKFKERRHFRNTKARNQTKAIQILDKEIQKI